MRKTCLFLVSLASVIFSHPASAEIIPSTAEGASGFVFNNPNRHLIIQEMDPNDPLEVESGCMLGCNTDETLVFQPNGDINPGGDEVDSPNLLPAPTLGSLGITHAGEINIIFDANEPNDDDLTFFDITLKFYDGDTLFFAIDGVPSFGQTFGGENIADYIFVIDDLQQAATNSAVFSDPDYPNFVIALEASIAFAEGGPESFLIVKGNGTAPVPEPSAAALLGLGLAALAVGRRRKKIG